MMTANSMALNDLMSALNVGGYAIAGGSVFNTKCVITEWEIPLELQINLALYGSECVRRQLLNNPNLSIEVLNILKIDPAEDVSEYALMRIDKEKNRIKAEFKEKINK